MDLTVCNICLKFYSSRSALKKHWLRHIEGSKYSCHLCSKCFSYKASYAKHLKQHKIKPKKKLVIKKKLSKSIFKFKKDRFKRHHRKKNKTINLKNICNKYATKKLKCGLCSWISNDYKSMKQHLISHGAKEIVGDNPSTTKFLNTSKAMTYEVFHCKQCKFSCKKRKELWTHLKQHILNIDVNKVKCKKCKLDFSSISELKMHMKNHLVGVSKLNECSDWTEVERKYILKIMQNLTNLFNCNENFTLK